MSKEDILQYFYTYGINYGVRRTFAILLCGFITGMVICLTYYLTSERAVYNRRFNASLLMILLTTEVIMLVISSNVVASLGMVGALSIVRFRTAIKDSRDTAFLFWAITDGLAVSSQHYAMAFTAVLFIALIVLITSRLPGLHNRYLLVIQTDGSDQTDAAGIQELIKHDVYSQKIRSVTQTSDALELILEIKTRGDVNPDLLRLLSSQTGIRSVNCVAQSGETVG